MTINLRETENNLLSDNIIMDSLLNTRDQEAMETIKSWINDIKGIPELVSTFSNSKLILIELLTKHRPTRLNVLLETFSFANALAALSLSAFKLPTRENLITILTNAISVSQNGYACDFILLAISNISSPCYTNTDTKLTCSAHVTSKSYQDERMIVSILEQINRLQAELWLTYPRNDSTHLMSPTSSTITTSSSSFSTLGYSTTATSTPGNDEFKLFDFVIDDMHERTFDADYDDVMKFKLDFTDIKSKIQYMLIQQISNHSDPVRDALKLLVDNCNQMQDYLSEFESGFVFAQLCKFISGCIDETNTCFESLGKSNVITRADLNTLEHWVSNNLHLIDCLSNIFQHDIVYKIRLSSLFNHCHELMERFKTISSVWVRVNDIIKSIEEGNDMLNSICLTDQHLSQHYQETSCYINLIQDKIFDVTHHDLQSVVNELVVGMESRSDDHLDACEKTNNVMVHSAFLELQQFKSNILEFAFILEKYDNKQKLKRDIKNATSWLQTYRGHLFAYALIDCLWCPFTNATIRQEGLLDFKQRFNQFTLSLYNDICSYFPLYTGKSDYYSRRCILFESCGLNYQQLGDPHLVEEYKWYQDFQALCDQVSDILVFVSQIQQQQADILKFIQHTEQYRDRLFKSSGEQVQALQKEASIIYKEEFSKIQWPTCLKYGQVGSLFYKYSQSLYLKVSNVKISFIIACQNVK